MFWYKEVSVGLCPYVLCSLWLWKKQVGHVTPIEKSDSEHPDLWVMPLGAIAMQTAGKTLPSVPDKLSLFLSKIRNGTSTDGGGHFYIL